MDLRYEVVEQDFRTYEPVSELTRSEMVVVTLSSLVVVSEQAMVFHDVHQGVFQAMR